jgi:hypothetical protein
MLGVTCFGLLFTPAFYTFIRKLGRKQDGGGVPISAPFPSLETNENRRFLAEDPAVNLRAFDRTRYLRISGTVCPQNGRSAPFIACCVLLVLRERRLRKRIRVACKRPRDSAIVACRFGINPTEHVAACGSLSRLLCW